MYFLEIKLQPAYAVLEEQIRPMLEGIWLDPLKDFQNPVEDFPKLLESLSGRIPVSMREDGCPLNNLAQEMASQDEGFQKRIGVLFSNWINAYTKLFEEAQVKGQVRADVNAEEIARFVVAALEGSIGVFKAEKSPLQWQACQSQLGIYLSGVRG